MNRRWISTTKIPLAATCLVFIILYMAASLVYSGFFSWRVFVNLLQDNAFLGLAAIGMTFVILSGGIDLSVGARIGFTSILIGTLISSYSFHPLVAIAVALLIGTGFGAGMGYLIHAFKLPPFLVTLAGMFLIRGLGFVISLRTMSIRHPFYSAIGDISFEFFPVNILLFLLIFIVCLYLAHYTRFGRTVYAIGGNEDSALRMGLAVGKTKINVYALSGLCSSLAGVVFTFYTYAGDASAAVALELDAIAAVVIGGTLLTGGVGYLFGTFIGVLILGVIQTIITFQGTLSSWWTKIFIGILLLAFILLQRLIQSQSRNR